MESLLGAGVTLGNSAFGWMTERDQAKYRAREAEAWARAYAEAAPGVAAATTAGAVMMGYGRDKLLIAGFAIMAVVVLFRIRPTANN